ncbi:hypothetical protein [Sodalis sp. dw_96]|uniref:hypothetical protein n=1 Tax=Sodalis sp. dw_96 TaxID=2719794 RepID=UPI001BD5D307|nr:hypothetical protein [Sodalis sp. dw_96]
MNPTDQVAPNITVSDMNHFLKDTQANNSGNKRISALSAVSNSGQEPKSNMIFTGIIPEKIPRLIEQTTPLAVRPSLAEPLDIDRGAYGYIDKKVKLQEFISKTVEKISTPEDFRAALREIQYMSLVDMCVALKAVIGGILNFADRNNIGSAVIEYVALARLYCHRCPPLRDLIDILDGENNIDQLTKNFREFIYHQLETENNCLRVAISYGITDEPLLHDLEHHLFNRLSNEEVQKSLSPEKIAEKYGIYESSVLELLEHKFVDYRAGVEVLKGGSVDDVAVKYNITSPPGRKRLSEYDDIAIKIKAGGNCFQLSQLYDIDLHNETSRIAMEELSIKHAAGAALLQTEDWRGIADRYGILTSRSRKKLREIFFLNAPLNKINMAMK